MSKRTITGLTTLLALTAGCGDEGGNTPFGDAVDEHIAITGLEISSSDAPALYHPLRVTVAAELRGEPWEADVVVGLRSSDREAGCVLGAMLASHPESETDSQNLEGEAVSSWSNEAEFFVGPDCAELVGRDDLELFAAFDPFDELGDGLPDAIQQPTTVAEFDTFAIVHAAAVSLEACERCDAELELLDSPGLDAQMRSASLASVVAVLEVAGPDEPPITRSERPDLMLTSTARVTGLVRGRDLDDDQIQLVHRIRPLGSSEDGLPLTARNGDAAAQRVDVAISDSSPVSSISALFFEGETRAAVIDGAWAELEEFELVSCLETEFEQAVYAGEDQPRANDCATIPVVVVRDVAGDEALPAAGAANINTAEVYQTSWSAGSSHSSFGSTGVWFKSWLDVNGSTGKSQTYKGIMVHSAGSWFEAGIDAWASIFGYQKSLIDIYATFLAYDFGGGGVAMGASIFDVDFIAPFELQLADGVPLSLQQMFDAAGLDLDPSFTTEATVAGIGFDDGCDWVTASVKVAGTVGINPSQTTITAASTQQGVSLSGTVTPYFDLSVIASASFDFWGIVSGGITSTLHLLEVNLPFTVTAELVNYEGLDASRLNLDEYAYANFEVLSGDITMWVEYDFVVYTDEHSFTIASWSGWNYGLQLFEASQILNFGSDRAMEYPTYLWCGHDDGELYTGDFDGDGLEDFLCHDAADGRKWIDYRDDGVDGTDWSRAAQWCFDLELHIGDFNGDGRDDMLCQSPTRKSIDYADQNGEFWGTEWVRDAAWCTHAGSRLRVEDLNGDGRDDLHCSDTAGNQWIDYADSSGQFMGTDWSGEVTPGGFCDQYDGTKVALRSIHNRYLAAPAFGYAAVRQLTNIADAELYVICIGDKPTFSQFTGLGFTSLYAGNSEFSYVMLGLGEKLAWKEFTPIEQPDGTWAFQTAHDRFISPRDSSSNYSVDQQTYIGSYEKFTVVPR